MANPYISAREYQLWRTAVANREFHEVDPTIAPKFPILPTDKVASAGSCFAQHIARQISAMGFNYFVAEPNPGLDERAALARQYGLFSARFGNLYTVHQLRQLFDEAVLGATKEEPAWERDGRYYDPFRPSVEPGGYASRDDVAEARAAHLISVRRMFSECDVFIFTLGLTEAWRSKIDGSVFPLAPGVAAGEFDRSRHQFKNYNVDEIRLELKAFLGALREVNPAVRVLLTVSPVPLAATFMDQHVLTSTTHSKAILRVVAGDAQKRYPFVDYFPSYEIITGSPTSGLYFEDDRRQINHLGVAHVMRSFTRAYTATGEAAPSARFSADELEGQRKVSEIVCDEDQIERSLAKRG